MQVGVGWFCGSFFLKILWIRLLRENGSLKPLMFICKSWPTISDEQHMLQEDYSEGYGQREGCCRDSAGNSGDWLAGAGAAEEWEMKCVSEETGLLGVVEREGCCADLPTVFTKLTSLIRNQSFRHLVCTVKFLACFLTDWILFSEVFIYKWGLMLIYLSEGGDKNSIAFWSSFSNEVYLFWEARYLICLKSRQKI